MDKRTLEQFKIDRIHIAPRALELSPLEVQRRFPHFWAPLEELLGWLHVLPTALVHFWLQQPSGHIVITHLLSDYTIGEQKLKHRVLYNVAYVGLSDLARASLEALVPVGHLIDHLLGNAGSKEGLWLSEGGGVNLTLQRVGAHVAELFSLGYGFDVKARSNVHAYFARSLALYLHSRLTLNVADPLMEKLLRTTLFADTFWRAQR